MNQDKYNKIKENFNNFLANRVSEQTWETNTESPYGMKSKVSKKDEQEGSANFEEEMTTGGHENTEPFEKAPQKPAPQLTPQQIAAVTKAVAEWWQLEAAASNGFAIGSEEVANENDTTLIDELRQILGNRGGMQEAKKAVKKDMKKAPKKAGKFTKKEVDAYKADHAKDSKGNFIKKDFKKK